jgi:hypothetical protein
VFCVSLTSRTTRRAECEEQAEYQKCKDAIDPQENRQKSCPLSNIDAHRRLAGRRCAVGAGRPQCDPKLVQARPTQLAEIMAKVDRPCGFRLRCCPGTGPNSVVSWWRRLRGWACKTRTQKRRRKISL